MKKKAATLLIALSITIILFIILFTIPVKSDYEDINITSFPTSSIVEPIEEELQEETIIEQPIVEEEKIKEEKEEETVEFKHVPNVPRDFKSWTNYKLLNHKYNPWIYNDEIAHTDENGLRKVDEYYCVAVGSYYSRSLGDTFIVKTEEGNEFKVIVCDFKSDRHTDKYHQYTARNYCIIEFYVDFKSSAFKDTKADTSGSISSIPGFEGKIVSIDYLGNYFSK